MPLEIIECEEFNEIGVRVSRLLDDGELSLDPRIVAKGYLNVSLAKGQVILRADRHVGLIPLTKTLAVRVRPRANITNLSYIIAKSGVAPVAIPSFSRGYLPRFESAPGLDKVYRQSLLLGAKLVAERGLMKRYVPIENPPKWRGRLLVGDTVRRHFAKGVRYKQEFSFNTLSVSSIENVALVTALDQLIAQMRSEGLKGPLLEGALRTQNSFARVKRWSGSTSDLVRLLGQRIALLPPQLAYYRDPLWTAFLLLQRVLPDMDTDGFVGLDSLIIDVSKVFEAYVRRLLVDRAANRGWRITDGNLKPSSFFTDSGDYEVKPDIVVWRDTEPLLVLDAKYKPQPKESDRYELLAFMDAIGVKSGAFVCPMRNGDLSRFLGTTASGRRMTLLRFDMSATSPEEEADTFFTKVQALIDK